MMGSLMEGEEGRGQEQVRWKGEGSRRGVTIGRIKEGAVVTGLRKGVEARV